MRTLFITFFVLFSFVGFSQKAKILDQETGKIIKNVSIFNKNKTKSSISDDKGFIDISSFTSNEIIFFSHISYA